MKIIFYNVVLLLLISCGQNNNTEIKPVKQDITESVYSSVTIQPDSLYNVYSVATGILEKTFIEEGDSVVFGQNLFQITTNRIIFIRGKYNGFFGGANGIYLSRIRNQNSIIATDFFKFYNGTRLDGEGTGNTDLIGTYDVDVALVPGGRRGNIGVNCYKCFFTNSYWRFGSFSFSFFFLAGAENKNGRKDQVRGDV